MTIEQIKVDLCVGCGSCINTCSMDVIRLNQPSADKEEITPCRGACPAGVNMRCYINLIKHGNLDEAIRVIREALPIPAIMGHVCFHPCEKECARKEVDEAVNINALERYLADFWIEKEKAKPATQLYGQKVAIAGSGPSGLAAAYELVKMGYPVTIFESESKLGGMLRFGIPEYRLPRAVLDTQIKYIEDLGVEFRPDITVGKDLTLDTLKTKGYEAVLFAIGAQLSKKIEIEGANLPDVYWGLDFLRKINQMHKFKIKDRVVIIGGGNVAIDVALTSVRLGAKEVQIFCLESKEEMPAHKEVQKMAIEESIVINESWGPKRLISDSDKLKGIELVHCTSVYDKQGKFNPRFNQGRTKSISADMVFFAIGESSDLTLLPEGIKTSRGHIFVDPDTFETSLTGVFAAGVVVSGPGSVIEAVATGKKAAVSIDLYLRRLDYKEILGKEVEKVKKPPRDGVEKIARQVTALLTPDERKKTFKEIKLGFNEKDAAREAQRCMACGYKAFIRYPEDCMTCYSCELDCPEKAIYVSPKFNQPKVMCWG